eukprot:881292-Rhodomonas_salina.3
MPKARNVRTSCTAPWGFAIDFAAAWPVHTARSQREINPNNTKPLYKMDHQGGECSCFRGLDDLFGPRGPCDGHSAKSIRQARNICTSCTAQ